jgi:hypothetical protein
VRAFAFLALTSCSFQHGSLSRDDAPPPSNDALIDAAVDAQLDAMPDAGPILGSCNPSGLTCIGGTATAMTCNNGCWVKCTMSSAVTRPMANAFCTSWGGKLAPIRSQADNDCVAVTLFPSQASWIGLEQDPLATTVGGGWTNNSDAVALTFTNWDAGQPNDADGTESGQEQCAFMPTNGTWHDNDCLGTSFRFSCRR